ncbi:hypothetical protein QBC43DRAFT_329077 [Cladorrhinum sp. PSN259]|nr:hypothetical protein QBC43DRAFT_329077 [Cladorrhinum sp. PSN259]
MVVVAITLLGTPINRCTALPRVNDPQSILGVPNHWVASMNSASEHIRCCQVHPLYEVGGSSPISLVSFFGDFCLLWNASRPMCSVTMLLMLYWNRGYLATWVPSVQRSKSGEGQAYVAGAGEEGCKVKISHSGLVSLSPTPLPIAHGPLRPKSEIGRPPNGAC